MIAIADVTDLRTETAAPTARGQGIEDLPALGTAQDLPTDGIEIVAGTEVAETLVGQAGIEGEGATGDEAIETGRIAAEMRTRREIEDVRTPPLSIHTLPAAVTKTFRSSTPGLSRGQPSGAQLVSAHSLPPRQEATAEHVRQRRPPRRQRQGGS